MMLALTVVEPQSSGIGGGGLLVYYDAKTGKTSTIDGREAAPKAATAARFLGADGKPLTVRRGFSGRQVGRRARQCRADGEAHKTLGQAALGAICSIRRSRWPGIIASRRAWPASSRRSPPFMKDFPATTALFWQDGRPKKTGEFVDNPPWSRRFARCRRRARGAFYTGPIAKGIVATVRAAPRNPSDMTLADMAAYRAHERAPVCMQLSCLQTLHDGSAIGGRVYRAADAGDARAIRHG